MSKAYRIDITIKGEFCIETIFEIKAKVNAEQFSELARLITDKIMEDSDDTGAN